MGTIEAVSYTHLDVYKRQDVTSSGYAIEGRTENQKINDNYLITWTGETAGQHHGVYTIQKARLTLDFENSQVYPSFGSTVNNDLHFTNLDAGKALEDWEIAKLREAGEPEYTADKSEAVKIDQQTGSVTVLQANETVRITARVADAVNFQDADASYTIHVHQASGMDIQVSARDLTYNNQAQALVTVTNPHNAAITYTCLLYTSRCV